MFLWALLCFVAVLPRSAGAFVLHSHAGHGLHVHLVSGLEDQVAGLDRDAFHARHHAHAHEDSADHPGAGPSHGDAEIFLGLPSEPVRVCALAPTIPPPDECSAPFLATGVVDGIEPRSVAADRLRPPRPRGRELRSGTRVLVRKSSALRL
ncbi:MAG: hypothetical protein NTY35_03110 [Planctomycetota bacterium]|nr:hypothetical protein [Planctomycetota bacterium]